MTLDFEPLRGFQLNTWKAETNKRRYIIVQHEAGGYTAKVGSLKTGDQEDVFRGAPTFQVAARACQEHAGGK